MALFIAPPAAAFGTVKALGQDGEHGHITHLALACPQASGPCLEPATLALLIGPKGDGGALGEPDLSTTALQASAHCDDGDFLPMPGYAHSPADARAALVACRDWMEKNMGQAVDDAGALLGADGRIAADTAPAKRRVIADLGLMLHAAQDFYSHSNWPDRPDPARPIGPANPPGLGHDGPAPFIALRGGADFPAGLMTGCFVGVPEAWFCNDGPGGRVKHASLNKDEGPVEPGLGIGKTPRGAVSGNFARAVTAAVADTRDKWALLGERLVARYGPGRGALILCVLDHDDPARVCR